ncbi:hypothetical protein BDA96_04G333400 [Sorghum bicolor]|uniref:Uncharacterized protein n=1 Tax=Sorghum bicolor TaxID=4558 RepID=A0A921R9G3_SORBI|nr:hypothetical protein BDA96_04G333400 [Sorghum bicolor]
MCAQLRTVGVEGVLVLISFLAALELSLLDHITTSQVLDLLLVHSEQPGPLLEQAQAAVHFLPS